MAGLFNVLVLYAKSGTASKACMLNARTRAKFPRVLQPLQQIFPSFRRHTTRSSECRNICRQAVSNQASRPSILTPEYNAVEDPLEGSLELGADLVPAPRHPPIKWRAASSILSIKERHLLSQAAVDTMV